MRDPEGWLPLLGEYRIRLIGGPSLPRETRERDHGFEREIIMSVHFNKDMTVENAFRTHAGAKRVFAKFHLGGCSHCAISETETIEQVSEGYGIPLPMLMSELEALFSAGTLDVGDRVRLPDEIRTKIPQLATVPEIGEVKSVEAGAYTVEFGEVRLQGLAEDFIKVAEPAAASA